MWPPIYMNFADPHWQSRMGYSSAVRRALPEGAETATRHNLRPWRSFILHFTFHPSPVLAALAMGTPFRSLEKKHPWRDGTQKRGSSSSQ
jgi:hypothetical protein